MADFLTELFGSAIAGGLSGAMRANREEALLEERALAALLKEGKGYIPERLLPFMGGYTGYPPEESQPFPWAEGESPAAPGRRWTYAESAQARGEREFGQSVEAKFNDPASKMYSYLKNSGSSAAEAKQMTLSVFGEDLPEGHWLFEEPTAKEMLGEEKAKTELGQKMGIEKVLPGIIGAYGKERFAGEMEPQLGRPLLEDLAIVPKREKAKAPKTQKTQEQLGEELYKRGQMMLSKIPMSEYQDEEGIAQKGRIPQTPQEHETYNLAKDYIDRGLKMMGSEKTAKVDWWSSDEFQESGFVGGELSPETQAYFKQWKTLEEFKASPEYQMLMANGTPEQIDQMEEDAESYFGGGF